MIHERWIHVKGYDVIVWVSDGSGYCVPTKNADANCPIYGNKCAHIVRTDNTEARVLDRMEYSMSHHLIAAHHVH